MVDEVMKKCNSMRDLKIQELSLVQFESGTRQPSVEVYLLRQARLTLSLFYSGLTIVRVSLA